MWLERFNTRIAAEVGRRLADYFLGAGATVSRERQETQQSAQFRTIQSFAARVDSEARPLGLGALQRAKLVRTFKARLREQGVDSTVTRDLTRLLLFRLSAGSCVPRPQSPRQAQLHLVAESDSGPPSVRSILDAAEGHAVRGEHAEAVACYRDLLSRKPRHPLARNNLGVALSKLGHYRQAVEQFRRATGIQSTYPDAQFNLGTMLRITGAVAESELPLRRAVKLDPGRVDAQVSLGLTLFTLGRLGDARECFERALRLAPRHPGACIGLGKVASLEGRFDDAETHCREALALDPDMPTAWASLVDLRRMTVSDGAWLQKAEKIASSGIERLDEADLRFAMGKYLDDTGEFELAFRNYQRANELQKATADRYDRVARERFIDDTIRAYSREAFSALQGGRSDSMTPVFVTGMMRSGTSLVEQIIAAHSQAHGAGELPFWSDAARKHEAAVRDRLPGEGLRRKLAEAYVRTLEARSAGALRVVDKSTFNVDHLGLIHAVLPNARMIYVQRDPIDTCLSCYFTQLSAAQNFTWDLADLAHYYCEHERLIDHWRSVLPAGTFLEVPYAELVDDQERWTRKMLDFIGLEWDERCLEFHTAERPVLTASFWQVRQKMYRSSVNRWRRYEKFIGPLRDLRDRA